MTNTMRLSASGSRPRAIWPAVMAVTLWINVSEIFRYFVFVMPMMRTALPDVPNVAPMNVEVFLLWAAWDTILVAAVTTIAWLALARFGSTVRMAVLAGTGIWVTIFGILWLGLFNMNLASLKILAVALPLSWAELVVAVLILRLALRHKPYSN